MSKKVIALVVIVILLLLGVLWKNDYFSYNTPSKTVLKKDASVSLKYKFVLDEVSTYELKFKQLSTLSLDSRIPLTQEFNLHALLNLKTIEEESGFFWVLMQLSQIDLKNSSLSSIAKDKLKKLYSKLFLVCITDEGEVLDIYFDGLEENFLSLKQTVYLMQIINRPYKYYELNEVDTNGEYKAIYTKSNRKIEKKIDSYYADANRQEFVVLDNNFSAIIDTSGTWLNSLNLMQKLKKKNGEFKNSNEMSLIKIETIIDNSLEIFSNQHLVDKLLKKFESDAQSGVNIWTEIKEEEDIKLINTSNIKLDTIMQKIIQKPKGSQAFLLLSKYLKANPESVFELVENFEEYDDYVQMHLVSIMEYVNTRESEKALGMLATNESVSSDNRVRAIVSIGSLKKPTQTSVETLNTIIQDNATLDNDASSTATLALGSLNTKLKDETIERRVKEIFNDAESISQKRVALYSIQNAGVDDFVEEVLQELESKSNKNRILALKTLGKMKDKNRFNTILQEQKKYQTNAKVIKEIDTLLGSDE